MEAGNHLASCCWMLRPHARPTASGYEVQSGKSELFPFCVKTSHFDLDQGVISDVTCGYNRIQVRCRSFTQVSVRFDSRNPSGPCVGRSVNPTYRTIVRSRTAPHCPNPSVRVCAGPDLARVGPVLECVGSAYLPCAPSLAARSISVFSCQSSCLCSFTASWRSVV